MCLFVWSQRDDERKDPSSLMIRRWKFCSGRSAASAVTCKLFVFGCLLITCWACFPSVISVMSHTLTHSVWVNWVEFSIVTVAFIMLHFFQPLNAFVFYCYTSHLMCVWYDTGSVTSPKMFTCSESFVSLSFKKKYWEITSSKNGLFCQQLRITLLVYLQVFF